MALAFYTDGQIKRAIGERFRILAKRLRDGMYTPFEFLHYIVHYYGGPYRGSGDWQMLQRSTSLTCDKYWERFLVWKENRLQEVCKDAKLQYAAAERHAGIGLDRTGILMEEFLTASAVARIELAVFWESEGYPIDRSLIVRKYGSVAAELAIGAPEWLHAAPLFRQFAQERYQQAKEVPEWNLLYLTMKAKQIL